jgi:GNAT superfamily N-acetyltransferase
MESDFPVSFFFNTKQIQRHKRQVKKVFHLWFILNMTPNTDLRIKNATVEDVPQIVAFIKEFAEFEKLSECFEATEENLREALFGERPCVEGLMAFYDGTPVGYAFFFPNFASFSASCGIYLEDLYVTPEARGKGVGLALIKRVAQIAKERGCVRMDFLVLDWNENAIKFYENLGAQVDDTCRPFRIVDEDFQKLAAD